MALTATQVKVWAASIEDRPGGLAKKLRALADSGVNLEFVIARRAPEMPGKAVVFATPIEGGAQVAAAEAAGFATTRSLHSVRVEGPDTPGLGAQLTEAVGAAGINLRGISAAAIGDRMICYLALDSAEDAEAAMSVVQGL